MFGGVASTSLLQLKMSPFSVITVTPLSLYKNHSKTCFYSSQKLEQLSVLILSSLIIIFFILHSPQKLIHVHDNGAYMFLQKNFITFAIITKDT